MTPRRRAPDKVEQPDPLRARLIAALRPRMTLVEAQTTVDQLLPEITAYAEEVAGVVIGLQADLVGQLVSAAQDCLDTLAPEVSS